MVNGNALILYFTNRGGRGVRRPFLKSVFPRNGRRIGKQPIGSTCCVFFTVREKKNTIWTCHHNLSMYYANKRWISRFQKTCASLETPVQYEIVAMATKFTSLWDQPSSGNAKSPLWRGVASVAGVASKRTRSEWRHNVLLRATGPRDGLRIVPASTLCVLADMRAAVARFICFFTLNLERMYGKHKKTPE